MTIALTDVLKERNVLVQMRSRRKNNALGELVDVFNQSESVRQPSLFLDQVIAREQASSTLAGNGVCFPHARTDLVDQIALALGRSQAGIPWNATGDRAHLLFLIAVPQQLVNDYLVLVGMLARITKNDQRRQAVLEAPTAADVLTILLEAPSL